MIAAGASRAHGDAVVAGWQARIRAAAVSRTLRIVAEHGLLWATLEGDVLDTTPCEASSTIRPSS
jgi:hypothetical protein